MKVLYTSAQVRQAVVRLFSSSKGRRVAITAFVGDGAEAYLSKPKGIELFCWPKAGSTNPYTLWELVRREVNVFFADSLHMKVYWTEDKGAVITSANLSTSALGAGGLREIGVVVPSSEIDIDRILDSLEYRRASDSAISGLETAHKDYWKRNPSRAAIKSKARTFSQWYEVSRPLWKLADVSYTGVRLSTKAKTLLEEEHGVAKYNDIMNTSTQDDYSENDWILCFNVDRKSGSPIKWMFAHHIVKIPPSDKKAYERDFPYQVLQVSPLRAYDQPPFQIDEPFRRAFGIAARELGGISKVVRPRSSKPSAKLLELIHGNY